MTGQIHTAVDVKFVMVPQWVLFCEAISDRGLRLYAVLRKHADNATGESYPNRKTLAKRCRVSVKTIDRALKELVDAGAVLVRARWKNATGKSFRFAPDATHAERASSLYIIQSVPPADPGPGGGGVAAPVDNSGNGVISVATPVVALVGGGDTYDARESDTSVAGGGDTADAVTRPTGTRPRGTREGGCVSGVRHQATAPVENPPDEFPSPYCPAHPGGSDVACGACGARRRQRKALEEGKARARAAEHREEVIARVDAAAQQRAACSRCDRDGFVAPGVKCVHDPAVIEAARRGSAAVRAVLADVQARVADRKAAQPSRTWPSRRGGVVPA